MPVDTAAIKERVDRLELIGRDTRLRKVASTAGGEYAGPCPFCGGWDRFRVQPAKGCAHGAGAGAAARAGREPGSRARPGGRAAGLRFLEEAEAVLWSAEGERARAYLHGRGLNDETLRVWRVGFQPQEGRRDPAEHWGFPARTASRAGSCCRGCWTASSGSSRSAPIESSRSTWPSLVATCLFGADTLVPGEPAILAEGGFDVLLLWQEAGDLIGIATLGSCSRGISPKALRYLLGCLTLLVAYDVDAEGEKGAERLQQLSARMHRIRPPVGNDITVFWQAGGRVRDWVRFELARWSGLLGRG